MHPQGPTGFGPWTRTLDDIRLVDFGLSCPLFPRPLYFWLNGQGRGLDRGWCQSQHRKLGQAVPLISFQRVEVIGVHAEIPVQSGYGELRVEHRR
jgi:hypothetical protein